MVSPVAIEGSRGASGAAAARVLRRLAPPLAILAAACALFVTSPVAGDFSWSDAPRHALNGAFVLDFMRALPWRHPAQWAAAYYLQYPALSILFYPPLFYAVEATVFAVFGVSHWAAQLTVAGFAAALGFGVYRMARLWLPRGVALGSALMLMGAPGFAFWGRQVMLDIPACALLVWGVYCFARFLGRDRTRDLALAVALLLAALYTKYNVVFVAPVLLAALLRARGADVVSDRRIWMATGAASLFMVPAILLNLKFGAVNFQSVADHPGEFSRWSLEAWLFYPGLLPELLGWPVVLASAAEAGLLAVRKETRLAGWPSWLLLGWLVAGYAFFTAISVREPRHVLTALVPLAIFAGLALDRLPRRAGGPAALALGVFTLGWSIAFDPVPVIEGHRQMADYVADFAPPKTIILFSGYRDGNFIFDLRTREDRRDLSVIRADKLLLRIAVERPRGVGEANLSEDQIAAEIRDLGVGLIVAEDGFWNDLPEMKRLENVLQRPDFVPVTHFAITGTMGHSDKAFTIYRPAYTVTPPREGLSIDMPIFGGRFEGAPH